MNEYDHFWKFHNKDNMDVHTVKLIENQAKRIAELEAESSLNLNMAAKAYTACGNYQQRIADLESKNKKLIEGQRAKLETGS